MADPAQTSSAWTKPAVVLATVFLLAFVLRTAFVLYYGPILTNDSNYYLTVAQGIQNGEGLGLPYRSPPVYPLFLAAVASVWNSHHAVIWAQALVGAATCVVLAAVCRRLFQPRIAFLLGILVALYIPLAAFCVTVLRETLIALGVACTTYCVVRAMQEDKPAWHWATGAACVFTLFNQATFIVFPFWLGLAYWIHTRNWKAAAIRIVPVVACMAIAMATWATRNYLRTSHFIPLSADHIGYFFLEGIMDANKEAKALTPAQMQHLGVAEDDPYNTYQGMRDYYWAFVQTNGASTLERKLRDGPVLFSRAVRLVRYEPGKYLRFSLQRLHRLWMKDLWVEQTESSYLNLRPLDRFRQGRRPLALVVVLAVYLFGYSALIGMAVFGKRTLGLLAPPVAMLAFHMWFHVETRYALAVHPHLLIFAVLAVLYLWLRLVGKRPTEEIRSSILPDTGKPTR